MNMTICGSVKRHAVKMSLMQEFYTACGWTVFLPDLSTRSGKDIETCFIRMQRLIDISDKVIIIANSDGSIGEHTLKDMHYAIDKAKVIDIIPMS